MNKILSSSVNPDKLALTFRGLIPLIIFLGMLKGVEITEAELNDILQNIILVIGVVGSAISAIVTTWGLIRKFLVKFKGK